MTVTQLIDRVGDDYYEPTDAQISEKTVTIQAGSGKAVGLGIYKARRKGPEVALSYHPDIRADIGVSYERLDIPGESKYILLYQFQNFSQKQCRITMRLTTH